MRNILRFLIMLSIFSGCEIINPEEPIPAYIYVESFDVTTDFATEGSSASKITDVWLFDGGDFLGSFPLPATIPVLQSGQTTLTLKAGIKDNGIAATPDIYPFYEPYVTTLDLKEGQVDTLHPTIGYTANTKFALIESFESGNHAFNEIRLGSIENKITLSDVDAFEGDYSALVQLDTTHSVVELATGLNIRDLTKTGLKVYLELNYKTDVDVFFGLIGFDDTHPAGERLFEHGVGVKSEWNKIYFNLSSVANTNDYDFYKVGFQSYIPKEGESFIQNNAKIYLDNIKLLHF